MIKKTEGGRLRQVTSPTKMFFYCLIGVCLFGLYFYICYDEYKKDQGFSNFGIKSEAIVVGVNQSNRIRSNMHCDVKYEFFVNDQKYSGKDDYSGICKEKIGDKIGIIYSSKNYIESRFVNHYFPWVDMMGFAVMFFFAAVGIAFMGIKLMRGGYDKTS